jgi:hypothetical protein
MGCQIGGVDELVVDKCYIDKLTVNKMTYFQKSTRWQSTRFLSTSWESTKNVAPNKSLSIKTHHILLKTTYKHVADNDG